mgnify:CR=1 FL=1
MSQPKPATGNGATPTEIGALTAITSPKWWLVVVVFSALGSALIAWSIFGQIFVTVTGLGVVVPAEGKITAVPARAPGRVSNVAVKPNDQVNASDLIAEIEQPRLRAQYAAALDLVKVLKEQRDRVARQTEDNIRQHQELAQGQIAAQEARLASLKEAGQFRSQVLADMEDEYKQGFATRTQLEQARGDKITNDLNLRDAATQIQNIKTQLESDRASAQRTVFALDQDVLKAEQDAADLRQNLQQSEQVLAPMAGRIATVSTAVGKSVTADYPVAIIEPDAQNVVVAAYFLVADGKRIQPGAQARVKIGSIDSDVYGTAMGEVYEISDLPSTSESLRNTIENETFVAQIQKAGAPLRVMIKLHRAEGRPGHVMMSSGLPSPVPVTIGTSASAQAVVQKVAPISYIIRLVE